MSVPRRPPYRAGLTPAPPKHSLEMKAPSVIALAGAREGGVNEVENDHRHRTRQTCPSHRRVTARLGIPPSHSTPSSEPNRQQILPLPDSAVRDFETRWAEERWLREAIADWQSPRRGKVTPESEIFIERALTRRELVHRRLTEGFRFHGGEVGGRWRAAFQEDGLRSDRSHVLRRIVQISPRQGRMQVGRSNEPPRLHRRPFGSSHAAICCSPSMT